MGPATCIVALLPIFYLPFPISIVPTLVCVLFSLAGLPSSWEEGESKGFQDKAIAVAIQIYQTVRGLVFLPLALIEGLISYLPFTGRYEGVFWNLLYGFEDEAKVILAEDNGMTQNNFQNEKWIYINGIGTDEEGAKENGLELYEMFGRPVDVVHNPTYGYMVDLFECLGGKTGVFQYGEMKMEKKLQKHLSKTLREARDSEGQIEKVVLVAHSQGTIITGKAIKALKTKEEGPLMKKYLHVYIFAGVAHQMLGEDVRYLENISNGGDGVACLGHLTPEFIKNFWHNTQLESMIYSSGTSVVEDGNWGHLLPNHYLAPMRAGKFSGSKLAEEYRNNGLTAFPSSTKE